MLAPPRASRGEPPRVSRPVLREHPAMTRFSPPPPTDSAAEGGRSGCHSRTPRCVPKVVVTSQLTPTANVGSQHARTFRYRSSAHRDLPHVVKFSGGRSSGMLLFMLLDNGLLDPERGDVVVFNNTASEHVETYRFTQACQEACERYKIPFFWVEFQTYEDARNGEWTRVPTYRLVNCKPRTNDNVDGFHWRGEVFEELISWSGFVPNQFSRICTRHMKLECTRMFLNDWLSGNDVIPRLGHYGEKSRINIDDLYNKHLRKQGSVPKDIFVQKRSYALDRPHVRPQQYYRHYSSVWQPTTRSSQNAAHPEYVAFVGLRHDERQRVKRVQARNAGPGAAGYEGEHVYMPLSEFGVSRDDVNSYWDQQPWALSLPNNGVLSNCVYCFLKGATNLANVRKEMNDGCTRQYPGFGSIENTPSDLAWWMRMERRYGRDLRAENRLIKGSPKNPFIGFFGTSTDFSYNHLARASESEVAEYAQTILPCDCTE